MHISLPHPRVVLTLAAVVSIALTGCSGSDSDLTSQELVGAPESTDSGSVDALSGQTLIAGTPLEALKPANLRTGPSADEAILLVVPAEATVKVLRGEPRNGYYQVSYAEREGWVFGALFRLDPIGSLQADINTTDIIYRAKTSVGFSYWWGHGAWDPNSSAKGSCSGSCPSCSHSGSWGADCSGMVAKAFVAPSSNQSLTTDSHPYHSSAWTTSNSYWTVISRGSASAGDAFGIDGHVFIYEYGDPWGSMMAIECKGCSYGCVRNTRTASGYTVTRRNGMSTVTAPGCGALSGGQALGRGASLKGCNGAATLIHQTDGNVVVYDRLGALWSTGTNGQSTSNFIMQTDGNLVLYSSSGVALWHTRSNGNPGSFMWMQDDCNLVVYSSGGLPLWNSGTRCR